MEHCQVCGEEYEYIYNLPDWVWEKITPKKGEAGLLCIECADRRAKECGMTLFWDVKKLIKGVNYDASG